MSREEKEGSKEAESSRGGNRRSSKVEMKEASIFEMAKEEQLVRRPYCTHAQLARALALSRCVELPAPLEYEPSLPLTSEKAGDPLRRYMGLQSKLPPMAERQKRLFEAARRIASRDYKLNMFHDDMLFAFPELRLYLAGGDLNRSTSGRSSSD
eukprot:4490390-Prymnesium_polylepis.1